MISYVQPYFYAYYGNKLIALYHDIKILTMDVINLYGDLLEKGDIIIKDRSGQTVYVVVSRPLLVDSNASNMWATTC